MTLFIINADPTEEVASALFLRHHQLLYRNRGNDKHLPMLTENYQANTFRISLKSSLSGPVSDKEHAKHTGYQEGLLV